MGGFHSFYISINNPKTFGYVGFFSAAIGKEQRSGGANEYIYDNFDKKLADFFAAKPKLFWIGIGNSDFLLRTTPPLERNWSKNHYTYMETDGGHIWRNWRIYLAEFVQKIF